MAQTVASVGPYSLRCGAAASMQGAPRGGLDQYVIERVNAPSEAEVPAPSTMTYTVTGAELIVRVRFTAAPPLPLSVQPTSVATLSHVVRRLILGRQLDDGVTVKLSIPVFIAVTAYTTSR